MCIPPTAKGWLFFFFFSLKKLGIRKRCWQLCMLGTIPDCWVMTPEFQSYLLPVNGHVTFSRFAAWNMTGHQSMVLNPEVTLESFRQLSNATGAWVHPLPFGSESQGRGGHGQAWWSLVRKNPQVFWPSPRMENPWISCSVSCLINSRQRVGVLLFCCCPIIGLYKQIALILMFFF